MGAKKRHGEEENETHSGRAEDEQEPHGES